MASGKQAEPQIVIAVTPVIQVDDAARSVAFYEKLGFEVVSSFQADRHSAWTLLRAGAAELMLESAVEVVDTEAQGIFLYLYTPDVSALYAELERLGLNPSGLHNPPYMPAGEFRLSDPDGYTLLIGQPA